jgi:hypothetical protein
MPGDRKMEEIKSHIEVLKEKAQRIEQGRIKPFRAKVMEHYFDSMYEVVRGMNNILKRMASEEDFDREELMRQYDELESFYRQKLDFQRRMLN